MEDNNTDNIPVIFTGPAVFTITEKIDNSVLEKFTKLYNEMLCGDVTGIRIYLASDGGDINCVNIMTDMINMSRYNIAIVASGCIQDEALHLFLNTKCTAIGLPDAQASYRLIRTGNFEYDIKKFKELVKTYKFNKQLIHGFIDDNKNCIKSKIVFNQDLFKKKILTIRKKFNPTEENLEEALSDLDLLALGNKADELGFLEDDAELSDKEFENKITNSAYGPYTKKELEEFKETLIQKGLYHRIKIIDNLLNNMK